MIPIEHIKERISFAYVMILAAQSGMIISKSDQDFGIDGTIRDVKRRGDRYVESSFGFDFQLKATETIEHTDDGNIKYDLLVKNYNDLVDQDVMFPRILILFELPRDKDEWVKVDETQTVIKNCAWWCSLKGNPESENKNTVRITIPKNQILTPEKIKELIEQVKGGEDI